MLAIIAVVTLVVLAMNYGIVPTLLFAIVALVLSRITGGKL